MKLVLLFKGTVREVWKEWGQMVKAIGSTTLGELKSKES